MKTDSGNGRIEFLRAREKQLREQIAQEQMRAARRKAKAEARLFALVGRVLVKYAATSPDFQLMLRQTLQIAVTDEHERRFLAECDYL